MKGKEGKYLKLLQGKYTATNFKEQENEKKRKYNQGVMDIEMGTFTPLRCLVQTGAWD